MSESRHALGVGLVGCGMIGQIHADGLRKMAEDGEIVAVGAADPSEPARVGHGANCAFGYLTDDPRRVIEDPDVDAVMITSPTSTHRDLVLGDLGERERRCCARSRWLPPSTTYGSSAARWRRRRTPPRSASTPASTPS